MIIRLGANHLVFTLNEKTTITSPEYILIIVSDLTNKQVGCKLGIDLSGFPTRFNRFHVFVNENPIALNSEVELDNYGFHKYYVYEIADADTFDFAGVNNLDLDTMEGLVEQGKIKYLTPEEEIKHYADRRQSMNTYGR